jgi:predicted ATPase
LLLTRLVTQVIKVVLPVVHGARYQCVKGPRHAFLAGLRQLDAVRLQQQQDAAEAADAVDAAAAASGSSGSPKRPVTRSGGLRLRSSCASEAAAGHMQQQPRGVQSPLVA